MKTTKEVLDLLGISRTWLYELMSILSIKPEQRIKNGKVQNYFSADNIRTLQNGTK